MLDEINLLVEIKDIRDELNIIKILLGDQRDVTSSLFNLVSGADQNVASRGVVQDEFVTYYEELSSLDISTRGVNKMIEDATTTYDAVRSLRPGLGGPCQSMFTNASHQINHLLDLRQKDANLREAFWTRASSEDTTKQGRTIFVFTIVTIIFVSFVSPPSSDPASDPDPSLVETQEPKTKNSPMMGPLDQGLD